MKWRHAMAWAALPAALFSARPAAAQASPASPAATQSLPDPATITLPDVTPSTDEKVRKDGARYFYFHKAGVSFAEAYADIAGCYRYLFAGEVMRVPGFAPWVEPGPRRTIARTPQYGFVGAIIGGMIAGPLLRSDRNSKLRRCLDPRGYQRFAIPKEIWKAVMDGDLRDSILRQAKLASGPTPHDTPVTE